MAEKRQDNYENLCRIWREKFLTWDHEAAMKRVGLENGVHEYYLELDYFGVPFRIDRETGVISDLSHPGQKCSFDTQMAIYHLLYYASDHPVLSGEWVLFHDIPTAGVFDAAYQRNILIPFAAAFSGKSDLLKKAGGRLHFTPIPSGDVGFQAEAFRCLPLRILFWDGDEEYPAQASILFDRNITQFTHPETVVLLAGELTHKLMSAGGFEIGSQRAMQSKTGRDKSEKAYDDRENLL